jgi:hypothetical protein
LFVRARKTQAFTGSNHHRLTERDRCRILVKLAPHIPQRIAQWLLVDRLNICDDTHVLPGGIKTGSTIKMNVTAMPSDYASRLTNEI